jgi:hypothetical protein
MDCHHMAQKSDNLWALLKVVKNSRSEVLTAVLLMIQVFWDVTPYDLVNSKRIVAS